MQTQRPEINSKFFSKHTKVFCGADRIFYLANEAEIGFNGKVNLLSRLGKLKTAI